MFCGTCEIRPKEPNVTPPKKWLGDYCAWKVWIILHLASISTTFSNHVYSLKPWKILSWRTLCCLFLFRLRGISCSNRWHYVTINGPTTFQPFCLIAANDTWWNLEIPLSTGPSWTEANIHSTAQQMTQLQFVWSKSQTNLQNKQKRPFEMWLYSSPTSRCNHFLSCELQCSLLQSQPAVAVAVKFCACFTQTWILISLLPQPRISQTQTSRSSGCIWPVQWDLRIHSLGFPPWLCMHIPMQ